MILDAAQQALLQRADPLSTAADRGTITDAAAFLQEAFPGTRAWQPPPRRPTGPPLPDTHPAPSLPQARWEADGFAVLGPVLGPRGLAVLAEAADRLQAAAFAASGMARWSDWVARITQIEDPADWEPMFASLEELPALQHIAAQALGQPAVRCLWAHLVLKPPAAGAALPWHTDRPTWPFPAEVPAVALWLALDPVGPDSGGLWYRPGSHRGASAEVPPVRPEVPAGSVLLHHGGVLHCSQGNASPGWRRAWIGVFGAA